MLVLKYIMIGFLIATAVYDYIVIIAIFIHTYYDNFFILFNQNLTIQRDDKNWL